MVNKEFFEIIREMAESKGIEVKDLLEVWEKALVNAYKKLNGNNSCKVVFNESKNEILLYSVHKVVEAYSEEADPDGMAEMLLEDAKMIKKSYNVGDVVEQAQNIKSFNRTAAIAAKNVFSQGIRTLEREKAYLYFKDLENEMIDAEITNITENKKKSKNGSEEEIVKYVILNIGHNITTSLPMTEFLSSDDVVIGKHIKVYVKKVEQTTKDPKVVVSRNERQLVNRLLENYIPEIKSGIIEIKGIARDAGDRCKIALYSNDPKVDAIGSCVGEAGSRIKEIVNALGGEKVDLYKWSEDPEELIANSLQPASVTKVLDIDPKEKKSQVVVPDEHLSLAIGKNGQNVRLAVQSCGWKIDIMKTSEAYEKGLLI